MNKYCCIVVLMLFSSLVHAHIPAECRPLAKLEEPVSSRTETTKLDIPYPQVNTGLVVQVFRKAVERGELKIFEVTVAFTALKPQQVEYIYKIGAKEPIMKVYSLLKKPMPLPTMPDILVEGVTVILDADGHILEAIAHCHP